MNDLVFNVLHNSQNNPSEFSLYPDKTFPTLLPNKDLQSFRKVLGLDTNIHEYAIIAWMSLIQSNPQLLQSLKGSTNNIRISPINYLPRESILIGAEVFEGASNEIETLEPETVPFSINYVFDPHLMEQELHITSEHENVVIPCDYSYTSTGTRLGAILRPEWNRSKVPLDCALFIPGKFVLNLAPINFTYVPKTFPYKVVVDKFNELDKKEQFLSDSGLRLIYYTYSDREITSKALCIISCYILIHMNELSKL